MDGTEGPIACRTIGRGRSIFVDEAVQMKTAFLLHSVGSAGVGRSRMRGRLGERLLMAVCALAAFLFVGLFVLGIL
jgi:hypothetical protein